MKKKTDTEIVKCQQVIHTRLYSSRAFDVLRKIMNAEELIENESGVIEKVFNKQTARAMKKADAILSLGCACVDQSTNEILIGPFEPEYDSLIDDLESDGINADDVCYILGKLIKAVCSKKTSDLKFNVHDYSVGKEIVGNRDKTHECTVKIVDANVVADFLMNADMSKYSCKLVDSIVGTPNNFIAVEAILSLDHEKAALETKREALVEEAISARNAKIKAIQHKYDEKLHAIEIEHNATLSTIFDEYDKRRVEIDAEIDKLRGRKISYQHLVSLQ